MRLFRNLPTVYLHRDVVDFRKSIDGLAAIVEQQMELDRFADALYVFCNRHRDRLSCQQHVATATKPAQPLN